MTLRGIVILFVASLLFMACKLKPTFSQVSSSITDTGYFPRPTGYVNDFARMFTMEQVHTLDSIIRDYEKRTTVEISIVTLDSSMVGQQDFDQYTLKLANYWGVGKKETKNGVLIAYAPYLRRIRINNGFGIEKALSDHGTKVIIDSIIVPNFKEGKFYEGTLQGIIAIMKKLS